jgi:hypothetical protein
MNHKTQFIRLMLPAARPAHGLIVLLFALTVVSGDLFAQRQLPEPPLPLDPRPIAELLSVSEKASLADAQAHGSKKAVEAYLKLSDSHLQAAFDAIRVNNYHAAEHELDIYNKAVAAAGKETFALKDGKRSLSKKIEQTLYRQIKTLESIDRLFPSEREAFAEAALKHAKQLRVEALNAAFASGGVLKDTEDKQNDEPQSKEPSPKKAPDLLQPLGFREGSFLSHLILINHDVGASVARVRATAQIPGDYLTEEEDNHVREAQAADARVKVFMKIADRRINAIAGHTATIDKPGDKPADKPADKKDQKKAEEEEREWGALPKGTRAELLRHYAKAIAECMDKLEDAYERNPKSAALPKALAILREFTDRHLQTLRALQPELTDAKEAEALRDAIDQAETANKGARGGPRH